MSFWNGVDLRYRLLKGPKIRISIAGIIISRVSTLIYNKDVCAKGQFISSLHLFFTLSIIFNDNLPLYRPFSLSKVYKASKLLIFTICHKSDVF